MVADHHAVVAEAGRGQSGLDVQDVGAQQTGMTKDAFKARLLAAGR